MLSCIYPASPHAQDVTQGQFFKWRLTALFSFSKTGCHTMVEELILPNYLSIAGERIVGFIVVAIIIIIIIIISSSSSSSSSSNRKLHGEFITKMRVF